MSNKNSNNFEVRITDIRTGEEKYVGLSNCIFLAAYEDGGTRLVRLSQCDLFTKCATYSAVQFGLQDLFKDEPVLKALVTGLMELSPIVKEDV